MTELSLNILDIANNSTKANATLIIISVNVDLENDLLTIEITDNGCGMSEKFLSRITDPYATTRTTRKVGLGIPLFKMAAQMSGGSFNIKSKLGEGTCVKATFKISHIDRSPIGSLSQTMQALIGGAPETDFVLNYKMVGREYNFDTREIKSALKESDICDSVTLNYLTQMIEENIETVNGGNII